MVHEVADGMPYDFPFVAMLRGEPVDYRRVDTPVIVQGMSGMETQYCRIKLPNGRITVASVGMLYVEQ